MKKAKFYVYILIDPRDQQVFYVGKGSGRRLYQHVQEARGYKNHNQSKEIRIREIEASGHEVVCQEVAYFWSEQDAYAFEADLIGQHDNLTNIIGNPVNLDNLPLQVLFDKVLFSPESIAARALSVFRTKQASSIWVLLFACAAKTRGLKLHGVSSKNINGSMTWQLETI